MLDPHPDPTGARVGYVTGGALHVIGIDGTGDQALATPEAQNVTYGLAEFVAAEEMYRTRGFWWSPDGQRLLVARVDTTPVMRWHISDPANPERPPTVVAYPQAGTDNAIVSVVLAGLDGAHTPVAWDAADAPYLISAHWSAAGPALLRVSSRDQQTMRVLAVADDGSVSVVAQDTDPDWVDVVPGTPAWTSSGELVRVAVRDGAYRLLIGDTPVTGPELNVRKVLDVRRRRAGHRPRGRLGPAPRLRRQPGRGDPAQHRARRPPGDAGRRPDRPDVAVPGLVRPAGARARKAASPLPRSRPWPTPPCSPPK